MSIQANEISQFKGPDNMDIKFRFELKEDAPNIVKMIEEDDRITLGGGLISGQKRFGENIEEMFSRYPKGFSIIGEDFRAKPERKICAFITVGIKDVVYQDQKKTIGILANLKISPEYRSIGLAGFLIKEAERLAKLRSVEFLQTYVEGNNLSYIELFKDNGYSQIGMLREGQSLLKTIKKVDYTKKIKDFGLVKYKDVPSQETPDFINKNFGEHVQRLPSDNEIYTKDKIVASTVEDENGNQLAGIVHFTSQLQPKISFHKFILPIRCFESNFIRLFFYILSVIASVGIYLYLTSIIEDYSVLLCASIAGGFNVSSILIYLKLYKLHELLRLEKEAVAFGLFYNGDIKLSKEIIGLLKSNFNKKLKDEGYRSVRVLSGEKNPEFSVLQSDLLGNYVLLGKNYGKLEEKEYFIDPRDVLQL